MNFSRRRVKKITERQYVHLEDCIPFDKRPEDLPYLKFVSLHKSKPSEFDLNQGWIPQFNIPNSKMRKIYWNEIYIDNELEPEEGPRVEEFRRDIINNYLKYREFPSADLNFQMRGRIDPPLDRLIECLDEADKYQKRYDEQHHTPDLNLKARLESCRSLELNSDNVAICRKHLIQPENAIAKIALARMNSLSEEEENRFKSLLMNEDFMKTLRNRISDYFEFQNFRPGG